MKTVSVGVQVSINLSPKESRAVKRLPVGLGTSMYWVMFSVTHCHGSGPRDDVGSALGICVMTISGATALIHAQRLVTARKRGIFMAVVIQIHQKRHPSEKKTEIREQRQQNLQHAEEFRERSILNAKETESHRIKYKQNFRDPSLVRSRSNAAVRSKSSSLIQQILPRSNL